MFTIENKLMTQFPHKLFAVIEYSTPKHMVIVYDAYATLAEVKKITIFIDKFMATEYPNTDYKIERMEF